jgi:hypothetical protein
MHIGSRYGEEAALSYLPTYCDGCGRAALVLPLPDVTTRCPNCGGANRIVPGATYRAEDVPLFIDIATVVYEAKLSRTEAARLAEELQRSAIAREPSKVSFDRLSLRIAGLEALRGSVLQDAERLKSAISMLRTAVGARSMAPPRRNSSGSHRAVMPDVFGKQPGPKRKF